MPEPGLTYDKLLTVYHAARRVRESFRAGMPVLVKHGVASLAFGAAADQTSAAYTELIKALETIHSVELPMANDLLAAGCFYKSDGTEGLPFDIKLTDDGNLSVSADNGCTFSRVSLKDLGQWLLDHREQKES